MIFFIIAIFLSACAIGFTVGLIVGLFRRISK